MPLEIKADGDTERQLLAIFSDFAALPRQISSAQAAVRAKGYGSGGANEPTSLAVCEPLISQQQIDDLLYLVQQQQIQIEQSRLVLANYEQAFIKLTEKGQPMLTPASQPVEGAVSEEGFIDEPTAEARHGKIPRYITGGLGNAQTNTQSEAETTAQTINASYRSSGKRTQRTNRSTRSQRWTGRLVYGSLLFTTVTLLAWVTFKWIAPAVDSFIRLDIINQSDSSPSEADSSVPEGSKNSTNAGTAESVEPASSLSTPTHSDPPTALPPHPDAAPGSAQRKAGTQPNALEGL